MNFQGASAVFFITLGLGQLSAAHWRLLGLSLTGIHRYLGYGAGLGIFLGGMFLLPPTFDVLFWLPLAILLTMAALFLGGAYVAPPPHPDTLFEAKHEAHGGCQAVKIPDGADFVPAYLLKPAPNAVKSGAAVCVVPGAGDNKTFFKWRLIRALLAAGLTVLTIDPHGHGDYRHRPLVYPACLSVVPAAVQFLYAQPGLERVGLIGVSLGGAMVLNALTKQTLWSTFRVDALVVVATPVHLNYSKALFYREAWFTIFKSPSLSLFQEASLKQIWQSWSAGGYRGRHTLFELFELLRPAERIKRLNDLPILLVYSQNDAIAPSDQALIMLQAAPQATLLASKKASHVMLTLNPKLNGQIATWLQTQLSSTSIDNQ